MPQVVIITCPNCKKTFEMPIIPGPCLVKSDLERNFTISANGIYSIKIEPEPKPAIKECPVCGEENEWEKYKQEIFYKPDPPLSMLEKFKKWFDKFLP